MQTGLAIALMITAVLLVAAILLQAQGSGFGTSWQGGGETYHTKRGLEKVLFYFTIGGIVVFMALALATSLSA